MSTNTDLMNGTIGLSSTHLILSFVLFMILIIKPDIVKPDYITIFLLISIIVNFILFCLFLACRNLGTKDTKLHNSLMGACMTLSFIHFIISSLMLNYTTSTTAIIIYLFLSFIINSILIYYSYTCKNLEG